MLVTFSLATDVSIYRWRLKQMSTKMCDHSIWDSELWGNGSGFERLIWNGNSFVTRRILGIIYKIIGGPSPLHIDHSALNFSATINIACFKDFSSLEINTSFKSPSQYSIKWKNYHKILLIVNCKSSLFHNEGSTYCHFRLYSREWQLMYY